MAEPIVKLVGLSKYFPLQQHWFANFLGRPRRILKAVDRIDLIIPAGQTFGLVNESGCGKSTLGRVLCTLLEPTDGQIYFRGQNLRELTRKELRKFKKEIRIVFQDPYSSLDPRMTISRILERPLIAHGVGDNVRGRKEKVFEMMRYTLFLLASAPKVPAKPIPPAIRLRGEAGTPIDISAGCRLRPRCPQATVRCAQEEPSLREIGGMHWVACWNT